MILFFSNCFKLINVSLKLFDLFLQTIYLRLPN